ncbi:MAG: hypothetical protein JWQ75_1092 [Pseudarthrobacter sp.]|nr:hypothetical protein [Pseudarthrobacter sp.]
MTAVLAVCLVLAAWLLLQPARTSYARFRRAVGTTVAGGEGAAGRGVAGVSGREAPGSGSGERGALAGLLRWTARAPASVSMTLVVQQLAALLKGGRTQAQLWDELWLLYSERLGSTAPQKVGSAGTRAGSCLSAGSMAVLGVARAAAFRGSPVSDAILSAVPRALPRSGSRNATEARIWVQLSACFDVAEASGCPLADVLTRFAAQLEVEDDAEAARQTALAGPRATVSLLTWLPLLGLGLGVALGVDPLAILVGTPPGLASLAAGLILTVAGRLWSARLVRAAAGAGVP